MTEFIPGLELARVLYVEAVEPILRERFPALEYGAALIGPGSDVLGFDTEMSMDHDWGPRLQLFVSDADAATHTSKLASLFRERLPLSVRGFPVNFSPPVEGNRVMQAIEHRPVNHRVDVLVLNAYLRDYLAFDANAPIQVEDWLTLPQQKLRSLTTGAVFREGAGLGDMRERLAYYPHDVWLYQMASASARISEDEHLLGRAGFLGDDSGARILAARIAETVMRLCFLIERTYAPYPKWFETAFRQLACAGEMLPRVAALLTSTGWQVRDAALVAVLERLANMQNGTGIAPLVDPAARQFFSRPFHVIFGERFANAIRQEIADPAVRSLSARRLIGAIDQVTQDTALLEDPSRRAVLRELYR